MELVQTAKMIKKTFQWLVHWCELQETLNDNVKNLNTHEQQVKEYLRKQKQTSHWNWSWILRFSISLNKVVKTFIETTTTGGRDHLREVADQEGFIYSILLTIIGGLW